MDVGDGTLVLLCAEVSMKDTGLLHALLRVAVLHARELLFEMKSDSRDKVGAIAVNGEDNLAVAATTCL